MTRMRYVQGGARGRAYLRDMRAEIRRDEDHMRHVRVCAEMLNGKERGMAEKYRALGD